MSCDRASSPMNRVPVSILVPIKNEAENLPRLLASVGWADEVFVVDSQSSDRSQRIAQEHGAQVVQFEFNGTWPKKKNWALLSISRFAMSGSSSSTPTKFCAGRRGFRAAIVNAGATAGYWINRRFMFMGRRLRHAYYPNWNLRLFRHPLVRYEKLTEVATASGDNEVHEQVMVQGLAGSAASWITTSSRRSKFVSRNIIVIPTGKRAWPWRRRGARWAHRNRKVRASRNTAVSRDWRGACPSDRFFVSFTFTSGNAVFSMVPDVSKSTFASGLTQPSFLAFEPLTEKLRNISARGLAGTGDDVLIGGLIVGGDALATNAVVVRAIGPSLAQAGVANPLTESDARTAQCHWRADRLERRLAGDAGSADHGDRPGPH